MRSTFVRRPSCVNNLYWGQIVLNRLTISPLKPLVRFLMKLGYNDHLVVGSEFILEKGLTPWRLRGGAKWGHIVLNLLTTSPLKPLVRF